MPTPLHNFNYCVIASLDFEEEIKLRQKNSVRVKLSRLSDSERTANIMAYVCAIAEQKIFKLLVVIR
ncbi:hypothetical protein M514_20161 [Trichuris suis]|uniref:Uncharacterized protein n=1 Tax=Trichuris suis TaxID=68888 RepID=A0A085M027_9BILA|nr:hypothetical protein M513_13606 [Trichuris suis]KFD45517.1 hypothetical protein M513_13611 [Trichuris suis]KFD50573.1 hypothetical protein M513_08522 [Trichuris suis]KFD67665.1 hypothetical protein M514_20161 [Trichuris suis]